MLAPTRRPLPAHPNYWSTHHGLCPAREALAERCAGWGGGCRGVRAGHHHPSGGSQAAFAAVGVTCRLRWAARLCGWSATQSGAELITGGQRQRQFLPAQTAGGGRAAPARLCQLHRGAAFADQRAAPKNRPGERVGLWVSRLLGRSFPGAIARWLPVPLPALLQAALDATANCQHHRVGAHWGC